MKRDRFSFVDIETTGVSAQHDKIIEVSIIQVSDWEVTDTFSSLVNPHQNLSPFITQLTGITPQDLEQAPQFYEIKDEIRALTEGAVFVAHNARFDYAFIREEYRRLGEKFTADLLCTVRLSRLFYPRHRHHRLDDVISRCDLRCQNRHRAFDDAKVLIDFINFLRKHHPEEKFQKAITSIVKRPTLPPHLSKSSLQELAESSGVYVFYGENGSVLYVGKSKNIRERVLSHFRDDVNYPKEMKLAQQVRSIECFQTAGELGALLLESKLIKRLMPVYNRQLRKTRKMVILTKTVTEDGYSTVKLNETEEITPDVVDKVMGVFRSKKQATDFLFEKAKEYHLCLKLLELEKTRKYCFGYHLGQCKGACLNKELPAAYNIRFVQAFSQSRIQRWPYETPVQIVEYSPETDKEEVFTVFHWCLVDDERDIKENLDGIRFDMDTYKILTRYFKTHPQKIKTWSKHAGYGL